MYYDVNGRLVACGLRYGKRRSAEKKEVPPKKHVFAVADVDVYRRTGRAKSEPLPVKRTMIKF